MSIKMTPFHLGTSWRSSGKKREPDETHHPAAKCKARQRVCTKVDLGCCACSGCRNRVCIPVLGIRGRVRTSYLHTPILIAYKIFPSRHLPSPIRQSSNRCHSLTEHIGSPHFSNTHSYRVSPSITPSPIRSRHIDSPPSVSPIRQTPCLRLLRRLLLSCRRSAVNSRLPAQPWRRPP